MISVKVKRLFSLAVIYSAVLLLVFAATNLTGAVATIVVEKSPLERHHTVIIDPGHGGEDGGATSVAGILESEYNLRISIKLRDLFHLLGFRTEMIRTEDISVYTTGKTIAEKKVSDLKNRVKTVNETDNAILISIHQNYFSDSRYAGAQVFYASAGESKHLAEALQASFRESINTGSKRNAKMAEGIYLMERINCTGILVECGFLSNHSEEASLRTDEYQRKICCIIASTVATFLTK